LLHIKVEQPTPHTALLCPTCKMISQHKFPAYFTEMCSGSKAGSHSRLIDFVYHSTLGLRAIKKKKKKKTCPTSKSTSQHSGFQIRPEKPIRPRGSKMENVEKSENHTAGYEVIVPDSHHLAVTLSVGTPLCPYAIADLRAYGSSTSGLLKKSLRAPMCCSGAPNRARL